MRESASVITCKMKTGKAFCTSDFTIQWLWDKQLNPLKSIKNSPKGKQWNEWDSIGVWMLLLLKREWNHSLCLALIPLIYSTPSVYIPLLWLGLHDAWGQVVSVCWLEISLPAPHSKINDSSHLWPASHEGQREWHYCYRVQGLIPSTAIVSHVM